MSVNRESKTMTLLDFLTDAEIEEAIGLKNPAEIKDKIIEPNIDRINESLGQPNDSMYLAYAVEYVLMQAGYR